MTSGQGVVSMTLKIEQQLLPKRPIEVAVLKDFLMMNIWRENI